MQRQTMITIEKKNAKLLLTNAIQWIWYNKYKQCRNINQSYINNQ